MASSADAGKEISAANFLEIRHIGVPKPASTPKNDQEMSWAILLPETVKEFTAVGYFFARELKGELDVPIGLINSSWGGTRIEPWIPGEAFSTVESLKRHRRPGRDRGSPRRP